ncbi:terminase [Kitasatospora purpeofusca]|uniref:terminase n=1 Tax=Kitasatospora purpeofusca TaxID=67352 RepID=UPI0036E56BB5
MAVLQVGNLPAVSPVDQGYSMMVGLALIRWAEEHLYHPDENDEDGNPLPWRYTAEQKRHLLHFYATDPNRSHRWIYRRSIYQRIKGSGKGPFSAAMALSEALGPCRPVYNRTFRTWTVQRNEAAWVQLAAVSLDQTANVFKSLRGMIRDRTEIDGIPVDAGLTRIYAGANNERQIAPVTSESKTLEGARPTFVICDEPHLWTSSTGGHRLIEVIKRNLAKSKNGASRLIITTNAFLPGEDSVLEREYESFKAMMEGRSRTTGILWDSIESSDPVPDLGDEAALRAALIDCRGDSIWLDIDTIVAEIYDGTISAELSRRFFLNQVVAAGDSWLTHQEVQAAIRDLSIEEGRIVAVGFDGSRSDDATAIILADVATGHCVVAGVWEKPDAPGFDDWEVPRHEVDSAVHDIFRRYRVAAMFCDLAYWESYVDRWADQYREKLFVKGSPQGALSFDMRKSTKGFTEECEMTLAAFQLGDITIGRHPALVRHLKNARRRVNEYGVRFDKESKGSKHKVDAATALVIARRARRVALERGVLEKWKRRSAKLKLTS